MILLTRLKIHRLKKKHKESKFTHIPTAIFTYYESLINQLTFRKKITKLHMLTYCSFRFCTLIFCMQSKKDKILLQFTLLNIIHFVWWFSIHISFPSSHCMKSVRIRSFSGPSSAAFGWNTDQKISKYGHFLRNEFVSHCLRFASNLFLICFKFVSDSFQICLK